METILHNFSKSNYDEVMVLRLFTSNNTLKLAYTDAIEKRNLKWQENVEFVDAGFDLFAPSEVEFYGGCHKIDFEIQCSAKLLNLHSNRSRYTSYYMYPRSSVSKSPLRLANSVGVIDAGYRGNVMAMFDCRGPFFKVNPLERYAQICAPNLCPVLVEMVDKVEDLSAATERGTGGFGSTGY